MLLDNVIHVAAGTEEYQQTASIGYGTWYFWTRGKCWKEKRWLVNYWKVQRKHMRNVAKEVKNDAGKGNRDTLKASWLNWKLLLCWKVTEALKKINSRKTSEPEVEPWKAKTEECSLPKWNRKRSWWCISKKVWTGSASPHFRGTGEHEHFALFCVKNRNQKHGLQPSCWQHRASKGWQDKSLKKWEGSKLISGKKRLCLKNENVESMSGCLW